jgi:hypothetical protein
MKVYRYPKSNKELAELTDDRALEQEKKNLYIDSTLDFDITIDKHGERHSSISLDFSENDLRYFHDQYLNYLLQTIRSLQIKNEELIKEISIHQKCWRSVQAASSELKFARSSQEEYLAHTQELASELSMGLVDQIEEADLKTKEITLEEVLKENKGLSASKALKALILAYKNYTSEFQYFLFDNYPIHECQAVISQIEQLQDKGTNMKSILDASGQKQTTMSPADFLEAIIRYVRKT